MRGRRCVGFIGCVALIVGAAACDDPAITLTYRPAVGTRTSYELHVDTSTTTRLEGQPTSARSDSFVLQSDQRVQSVRHGSDTRVRVRLTGEGQRVRNYVVRLDRAGQLATVETVEGVPSSSTLGNLGISELLPSAAGALPRRALRPGDRWSISQSLRIGDEPAGRLVGRGRLTSLGVSGGVKEAIVDTEVALPVDRTTTGETGETIHLVGSVRTVMTVTQRVRDGVVLAAKARSVGRYDVTLLPPSKNGGPPVRGTLTVIVSSTTRAR
jgi:hypothetical protein